MSLEEEFKKETGLNDNLVDYVELYNYECTYSKWLEEKQTWKKFGEKKPITGSNVFIKSEGLLMVSQCISSGLVDIYVQASPQSEWMYAPN